MPKEATEPPKVTPEYLQPIVDDLWNKGFKGNKNLWKFRCRLYQADEGHWNVTDDGKAKKLPLGDESSIDPENYEFFWIGFRNLEATDAIANFLEYPKRPTESWPSKEPWEAFLETFAGSDSQLKGFPKMVAMLAEGLGCDLSEFGSSNEAGSVNAAVAHIQALDDGEKRTEFAKGVVAARIQFRHALGAFQKNPSHELYEEVFLQAATAGAHFQSFEDRPLLVRGYAQDQGRGGNEKECPDWLRKKIAETGALLPKDFFKLYDGCGIWKETSRLEDGMHYLSKEGDVRRLARLDPPGAHTERLKLCIDNNIKVGSVKNTTFQKWVKTASSKSS